MTVRRVALTAGCTVAACALTLAALCLAADRYVSRQRGRYNAIGVWA